MSSKSLVTTLYDAIDIKANTVPVCVYVKNYIKYDILSELVSNDFEAIWLKLKPLRLPRGISCIILCNLYHPPKGNDQDLINYLYEALTTIEARFTNCGVIILGDFNKLSLSRMTSINYARSSNFQLVALVPLT
jgi:hypothetical protein